MELVEDIMVSVICTAYNHEPFIRKALEGFVSQVAEFKYEIIINDDCSTDKTAAIIKEYEKKYPDIIRPIFQKENQHAQHIPFVKLQMLPKARGKYLAWCEGDDFWTDPYKLKRQVDALEANPDCSICFNRVALSDIRGNLTGAVLPPDVSKVKRGKIEGKVLLSLIAYPGPFQNMLMQLSGYMCRKSLYEEYLTCPPDFRFKFDVGDLPLFLYMGTRGNGFYIDNIMSVYRTENPDSWAGNISKSKENQIRHLHNEIHGLEAFDEYSHGVVRKDILLGVRNRKFFLLQLEHDIKGMKSMEMAELYSILPLASKVKEYLFHFFPIMEPVWKKLRRKYIVKRFKKLFWG